jgi:subtilisin-like proprotein convertase family protein
MQGTLRSWLAPLVLILLAMGLWAATPAAADDGEATTRSVEIVGSPIVPVKIDIDLRDLPRTRGWQPGDPVREIPRRFFPREKEPATPVPGLPDPLVDLQRSFSSRESRGFTTPFVNIEGQSYSGVSPPDPVGDVGPDNFVQAINDGGGSTVVVYKKADGGIAAGPFTMESLAAAAPGYSGPCETQGNGDPIVLYDDYADRWFLQEFTYPSSNHLCVYISQTSDPTAGGWNLYDITMPAGPDYPHFGIWPDAYIGTVNDGSQRVIALDRANMLTGSVARAMQAVTMPDLNGYGFQAATAADADGDELPPAGAPAIVMRHVDDEAHSNYTTVPATDILEIWAFDLDWDTPANSTFTKLPDVLVTDYNSWFEDYTTFYSVPQPGTSTELDPIREVILNRLQYRNFGSHETLIGVFPTNIDEATSGDSVNAGLRWFELRRIGDGDWTKHQEGTYQPGDSDQHRFVGSIAMDQSGNIALAYSYTEISPAVYPSLKYTGRLADDQLNIMSAAETDIVIGTGAGGGRWGDYAAMAVDPVDDCTFWFTGEYETANWTTRIASFAFEACGCELILDTPTAAAAVPGDNTIRVTWNDSSVSAMAEYRVYRGTVQGGPYDLVQTIADSSPGTGGGAGYSWDDTSVSGGTTYYYIVRSSDGSACVTDPSNEVSAEATGVCTLAPLFDGVTAVTSGGESTCTLDVEWAYATGRCGQSPTYNLYRSETPDFVPGPANMIASGLTMNLYEDQDELTFGTTYYYTAHAVDPVNFQMDANDVEASGAPAGPNGGISTYTSSDTPIAIPDSPGGPITSTINVPASVVISDLNVEVDITHSWKGDLIVELTSPEGTTVTLHNRSGSSTDNVQTTYDSVTTPDGPGSMADFDGENALGDWTLSVEDEAGSDIGDLNSWTLLVDVNVPCETGNSGMIFEDGFEDGEIRYWLWHLFADGFESGGTDVWTTGF